MAEQKKPSNGRRKPHPKEHPAEHPAETPEPAEPANSEPAEAEHPEPETPDTAAELPPDEVAVSLSRGGRGNVKWDGKEVRIPVPGSWISFPGFAGQNIDEVIIPPEAVEELCRNIGYAVPPTEVRDAKAGG